MNASNNSLEMAEPEVRTMSPTVLTPLIASLILFPGMVFAQNYDRAPGPDLLADQMRAARSSVTEKGQPEDLLLQWSTLGVLSLVKDCLDQGVNINSPDKNGLTALMFASDAGYGRIVALLLQKGANVNAKSGAGITALELAAAGGRPAAARLLIEKGADVNAGDATGMTPLMAAARAGRLNIVKMLLEKGADMRVQDGKKNTALDYAELSGYDDVANMLKRGVPHERDLLLDEDTEPRFTPK
jgi:ankyrin repeat protein